MRSARVNSNRGWRSWWQTVLAAGSVALFGATAHGCESISTGEHQPIEESAPDPATTSENSSIVAQPEFNHTSTSNKSSIEWSDDDLDPARVLTEDDLKKLPWRSVGPANMGGRVAALAFAPGNPKTYYVGYATGGVWKTTNAGTTFTPVFDKYETSSIGSLAVCDAPPDWPGWADEEDAGDEDSDTAERGKAKIVWVGTGEGNGRNSSSWGHGVYRSTDGGSEFTYVGLKETHDITALAVDPRNPDVCYVAAMGHLWGPNEERGA